MSGWWPDGGYAEEMEDLYGPDWRDVIRASLGPPPTYEQAQRTLTVPLTYERWPTLLNAKDLPPAVSSI